MTRYVLACVINIYSVILIYSFYQRKEFSSLVIMFGDS